MQLTGKQIIERGIITNYTDEAVQQQGIDVRLDSISEVGKNGYIPSNGKTKIPDYHPITFSAPNPIRLEVGYYEVTLQEGCEIPKNATLHFKTRSSLVRSGAIVHSGQFDAGFKTDKMGCFLQVIRPIYIEHGARIAQAIVFESADVENLYDGQWQGDKQRIPGS